MDSIATLRGRVGAFVTHSRHDPRETTSKARATFLSRFERQVREEGKARGEELSESEVARRAEAARKAYFTRLALRSAVVRRKRAEARGGS